MMAILDLPTRQCLNDFLAAKRNQTYMYLQNQLGQTPKSWIWFVFVEIFALILQNLRSSWILLTIRSLSTLWPHHYVSVLRLRIVRKIQDSRIFRKIKARNFDKKNRFTILKTTWYTPKSRFCVYSVENDINLLLLWQWKLTNYY